MITTLVLLSSLTLATYTDLKEHKIYNKLVFPLMILGFIYQCYIGKTYFPSSALKGFAFPLILLPFFALNMIGAGDIKLFMVAGIWLGFGSILDVIIYAILAGGALAIILLIVRKNGIKRLKYLWTYLKSCLIAFKPLPYQEFDDQHEDGRFPFAVVILCGYGIFLLKGMI